MFDFRNLPKKNAINIKRNNFLWLSWQLIATVMCHKQVLIEKRAAFEMRSNNNYNQHIIIITTKSKFANIEIPRAYAHTKVLWQKCRATNCVKSVAAAVVAVAVIITPPVDCHRYVNTFLVETTEAFESIKAASLTVTRNYWRRSINKQLSL